MAEAVEKTCYRHPDRVTGLSCSECGVPLHRVHDDGSGWDPVSGALREATRGAAGDPGSPPRDRRGHGREGDESALGINVAVYVAELLTGGGVNGTGSTIYEKGVLFGPFVEQGDWWRLLTAAFLHYGPVHLILNMVGLWWFGSLLEQRIGAGRYLMLYLVSGLAGSAGALLWSNGFLTPSVGASGAIFGILGAGLVLERQRDYVFGGSAMGVILINFVLTFSISSISKGGHIGGLVGGIICALGLTRFGRGTPPTVAWSCSASRRSCSSASSPSPLRTGA